jgi:hypothetical protein
MVQVSDTTGPEENPNFPGGVAIFRTVRLECDDSSCPASQETKTLVT